MNQFVVALRSFDLDAVKKKVKINPDWLKWRDESGRNALHIVCSKNPGKDKKAAQSALAVVQFLIRSGMDINSIHEIPDDNSIFPATPLWHAYAKGRNERVYAWLLKNGADPERCMWAIAWNDDVKAANLFSRFGARTTRLEGPDDPFCAAFLWKRFKVANWFLEHGADVNFADKEGNTVLYYAIKRKFDFEWIEFLYREGADFDRKNNEGVSARMLATQNRRRKILRLFDPKSLILDARY